MRPPSTTPDPLLSTGTQGDLAPGVVPRLLRSAYAGTRTGALRFTNGPQWCAVRFANGHIVRADASAKHLRLGEVMVARGLLSEEALQRSTGVVLRDHRPLGGVLKEMGFIDQDTLEEALVLHVCEVLAHMLSWHPASYNFEASDPETFLEETDYPLRMSTGNMILEAVTLLSSMENIRHALGDLDRVLLPSSDSKLRFQHMNLSPTDGFVLSRIDGTVTAREVISVTPLPVEAVERSLLALLCAGIVEDVAAPPTRKHAPGAAGTLRLEILAAFEGRSTRNHFQVLGVPMSASDADVKATYFQLAKRLHPDVHHAPELSDLVEQLHAVFARLNEAYEVLSNPRTRAAYQARLEPRPATRTPSPEPTPAPVPPPSADELFQRGKECFDGGRSWEAVALLGEAVRFAEGKLRTRARVLLAQAYLKSPGHVKNAEHELHAALQDDPTHVDAFFFLGVVYQQAGLTARATSMLKKVLALHPGHPRATSALNTLTREL